MHPTSERTTLEHSDLGSSKVPLVVTEYTCDCVRRVNHSIGAVRAEAKDRIASDITSHCIIINIMSDANDSDEQTL